MSDNIKVSIIVPIYNVEDYLERCLESLVNQTLKDIQIILVNDGSPDNSQIIIDKYAAKYPDKILALVKENGGLSDARNYGIPYAKGEYIGFVDSDDYLDVTMYEKMYHKAVDTDSEMVVCGYYGVNEKKNTFRQLQMANAAEFGVSLMENPTLLYSNAPYAWNKLFKRELFERTGIRFPKGKLYEDIATTYPMMQYANRIAKVNEPLYYYILQREGAITSKVTEKTLQMFDSLAILNEHYKASGNFELYKKQLCFINLKHTMLRFKDFHLYNDKALQRKMVDIGFNQLNQYFDDWKKNDLFFNAFFGRKKSFKKNVAIKTRLWWYGKILMPNSVIKAYMKIKGLTKKVRNVFKNKKFVNKYTYVKAWRKEPLRDKQVLFESFHGTAINDSPFAMMKELAKDPAFQIYYTSKENLLEAHQQVLDANGLDQVKLVALGTKEYQKILATSKYLVNNVSFPTYFVRREGQICLNTWHGTPLKTLGKKMAQGIQDMSNMQRNFLQSTHLLHPNRYTMDHMMADYNLNHLYTGEVILNGYPRNSIFLDKEAEAQVREQHGMIGKEVFAYMPTWRGATSNKANGTGYEEEVKEILNAFDGRLTDNQILYVNLHPLVRDKVEISGFEHIRTFPTDIDNYSFLNAVDVLITDYSSVFFDYSVTGKPVVLFMYDYENYMAERGMYMDVRTLPFEKIYHVNDMLEYFGRQDKNSIDKEAWDEYVETFIKYDDTNNTKKVNDYIFYHKNENMEVFDYSENMKTERTLYLAEKIKHLDDVKRLKELETLEAPVALFMRKDFTPHTLQILSKEFDEGLDYLVGDANMFVSPSENMRHYLARRLKKYWCKDIYRMELRRILPNIKIKEVITAKDTYRSKSLKRAAKGMKHIIY